VAKPAWTYHQQTSYVRHKMSGHVLDWHNQPSTYKHYADQVPLSLPREVSLPEPLLSAVIRNRARDAAIASLGLDDLSRIFLLTYSLTARARHSGGDFYYRSAASAGALYPTEIYMAAQGVTGLEDGLYHFSIAHHGLLRLRRGKLAMPLNGKPPKLVFFLSAIFFRSAWKYRDRAYRYHLLDTGHVAENLLLALGALGLPCQFTYDFDDREVNHLLGLDPSKEVALALCRVPGDTGVASSEDRTLPDLPEAARAASCTAREEIDYPSIGEIHQAGMDVRKEEGPAFRMIHELGPAPAGWEKISQVSPWPETLHYANSVFHRRSRRNFIPTPLAREPLMALLEALCNGHALSPPGCIALGFLTTGNPDMGPGFYLLDREAARLGLVSRGHVMEAMARICLDQAWLSNAALHVLFMANLERVEARWGTRGYRYAMMEAGRLGERLYLCATAMGLGCCGIGAFYDGEAAELLNLNTSSRLLYLVAVGPVKSAKFGA
jgi:SagB-type dehydrogenase family enzyme